MKLGVFTVLLSGKPLDEVCSYLKDLGVQAIELGCGGYPGKAHCDPKELLGNPAKIKELKDTAARYGLEISALSAHGNMIHPDPEQAKRFSDDFDDCLKLAGELGVNRVVTFSGCPGGAPGDKTPNWVTCPWPDDYLNALEYQWNDVLIPYWQKTVEKAKSSGVDMIALEMHPGFCVYNPETLLRLRKAVGPVVGANLDPSHLFWQGIDIVAAIRYLGDAIQYVHGKDTRIDPMNTAHSGVLDTKHYGDEISRAWVFRTIGYGHGLDVWKEITTNLRMIGYDDVVSIEHEDSLMSVNEGLTKAISLLKEALCYEERGGMWWA